MVFVAAASAFFVLTPLLLELWAIHLSRRPASRGFVRWLKYILPGLFLISVESEKYHPKGRSTFLSVIVKPA